MHKPIGYYQILGIVLMMSDVCCLGHIAPTSTAVLYDSTPHLVVHCIMKLKPSYNGVLRRLLLTLKPYSSSEMFVTHGVPSCFLNYFANVYIIKSA